MILFLYTSVGIYRPLDIQFDFGHTNEMLLILIFINLLNECSVWHTTHYGLRLMVYDLLLNETHPYIHTPPRRWAVQGWGWTGSGRQAYAHKRLCGSLAPAQSHTSDGTVHPGRGGTSQTLDRTTATKETIRVKQEGSIR